MTSELDRAKTLFKHYFKVALEESGVKWNSDYSIEIEEAIDNLVSVFDSKIKDLENEISDLRMNTGNY